MWIRKAVFLVLMIAMLASVGACINTGLSGAIGGEYSLGDRGRVLGGEYPM